MKILTGTRFLIALAITILVLIFMSGQFARLVWFALIAGVIYIAFTKLANFDKLPARLEPFAKRAADKSAATSRNQQVSQAAPSSASTRQTVPVERPEERDDPQEAEEWDDNKFNDDLRSRFVGQAVIDALEEEVTSYLESSKKRPLICVIEGPEQAGKSELFAALSYAFGRQFSGEPEPIIAGARLDIIDNDFIERQDIAIALVSSLDDKALTDDAINSLKLFAHTQTSKLVFLFVKGQAPERLIALARKTIPIDKPNHAALCHMRFRRIFDEDHNIKLTIPEAVDRKLANLLQSVVRVESANGSFKPKDINDQLRPRVGELVKAARLNQDENYTLKRVPKVPSTGKIQWEGFEFLEEAHNESRP